MLEASAGLVAAELAADDAVWRNTGRVALADMAINPDFRTHKAKTHTANVLQLRLNP